MDASEGGRYVFTFTARKRSRSNPRHEGILRTHRFYIEYYSLLKGQEVSGVIENNNPRIAFPVRFTEMITEFARELGGKVVEVRRARIPKKGIYYEKLVVLLPNEMTFRRHLLFSLTISTYRKTSSVRFNAVKNLLSTMNANLLNILTSITLDRYNKLSPQSRVWQWYMLRVGRALKVLYKLD